MHITVEDLLKITGGELYAGTGTGFLSGAIIDSREAKEGDLFFPLQGEQQNGHPFIADALKRGASASLLERSRIDQFSREDFPSHKNIIVVENCLESLQHLASVYCNRHEVTIVAITGSNGKTTTKDLIASVLNTRYRVLKTEGNFNNHIGLPLTLLRLEKEHEVAVLEMGMRGLGEIAFLCSLCPPDVGVITNIGESHLELLGSKENISKAKGELLESMNDEGTAVLNGDDPFLRKMGESFAGRTVYYGCDLPAELRAYDIHLHDKGYKFSALLPEAEKEDFWVPLPGRHNVYNALAAVAVGLHLNLTPLKIREGLAAASFSAMRMERITTGGGVNLINDAYNASPTSMELALQSLKEWAGEALSIAVLGDMFELGEYAREGHLRVGRSLARMGIDYLVTVGKQALWMGEGAREGGLPPARIANCSDHDEALKMINTLPLQGSYMLVKGSRGMSMETIVESLLAKNN